MLACLQTVLLMWGASQHDMEMAVKVLSQVCNAAVCEEPSNLLLVWIRSGPM